MTIFKVFPKTLRVLLLINLAIGIYLACTTIYINFWPSDSHNPYIPTAARLFQLHFLSQMHQLPTEGQLKIVMHGKEALILAIALMQKILGDTESLYPNTLVLILAIQTSTILFYFIFEKYFGAAIAVVGALLFMTSFSSYMYMLLGAHPPLAMMNFLWAVVFIQNTHLSIIYSLLSGIFLGLMFFSSPTASLYLPYYLGFVIYEFFKTETRPKIFQASSLIFAGCLVVFLLFTLPDPLMSLRQFTKFLRFSQKGNNFVIYHDFLSRYFSLPNDFRGGGWIWIIKYAWFVMPVLFFGYISSLIYLIVKAVKNRSWVIIMLIAISLSTPVDVEISKVVQFGRNYYSWLFGLIFLVCTALFYLKEETKKHSILFQKISLGILYSFLTAHILFNSYYFLEEILPSKMATNKIYNWLLAHHTNVVYVYNDHPLNKNFVQFLNNPKYKTKIYFWTINTIKDARSGYILVPPITGKTILDECRGEDFANDPYLTQLFNSKEFSKYTAASFKTIATSRQWNQEEEICTYRDLIAHQISDQDRQKGYAWLLDADKLQREWFFKTEK